MSFILEIVLIAIVIFYQIRIFLRTRNGIEELENAFPTKSKLRLKEVSIPDNQINTISENEVATLILKEKSAIIVDDEQSTLEEDIQALFEENESDFKLIATTGYLSPIFSRIQSETNVYLVRNKNHAADFKIIREIAERNGDAQENQIDSTISMPLYLGLLGTILGIVFGLLGIVFGGSSETAEGLGVDQLNNLLTGVAFAMVASFIGLLLTIINSGWAYKKALKQYESDRNSYYTFVQTELLPVLSKDMASSLSGMRANLEKFNSDFNHNIGHFSKTVSSVQENLRVQADFLDKLDRIGFNNLAQSNVEVFQKISENRDLFESFFTYQEKLKNTLATFEGTSSSFFHLINKFQNFESGVTQITEHIKENTTEHARILEFVDGNLNQLKNRESHVKEGIDKINNMIQKNMEAFQDHLSQRIESMKELADKEESELQKAFEASKTRLNNLDFLSKIDDKLNKLITVNEKGMQNDNSQELSALKNIDRSIGRLASSLNNMTFQTQKPQPISNKKSIWGWVKGLFVTDKKSKKSKVEPTKSNRKKKLPTRSLANRNQQKQVIPSKKKIVDKTPEIKKDNLSVKEQPKNESNKDV